MIRNASPCAKISRFLVVGQSEIYGSPRDEFSGFDFRDEFIEWHGREYGLEARGWGLPRKTNDFSE